MTTASPTPTDLRVVGPQYVVTQDGRPWAVFVSDEDGCWFEPVPRYATHREAQDAANVKRLRASHRPVSNCSSQVNNPGRLPATVPM